MNCNQSESPRASLNVLVTDRIGQKERICSNAGEESDQFGFTQYANKISGGF